MYSLFMGKGQPLDSGTQDTYIYNYPPSCQGDAAGDICLEEIGGEAVVDP